jgi:hypothetical protein
MSSIYNSKLRVLDRAPSTTTRRLFSSPDRAPSINITVPYIIPSAPPREQPRPVPLTSGGGPVRRAHLRRRSPPARSPPAVAPSGAAHLRRRPVRRGSPRTWPLRRGNPFWWQPPPATTPPPVRIGILVPLTRYRDLSTWTVYLFPAARDEITNTNCYWFLKKHHGLVSALPALPFQVDM